MKTLHYELWFYDVWGNEQDGFEVNDRRCASEDFVIMSNPKTYNKGTAWQFTDFIPTDQQVLTALINNGDITPWTKLSELEFDGDDQTIYLTESENGRPLCELVMQIE